MQQLHLQWRKHFFYINLLYYKSLPGPTSRHSIPPPLTTTPKDCMTEPLVTEIPPKNEKAPPRQPTHRNDAHAQLTRMKQKTPPPANGKKRKKLRLRTLMCIMSLKIMKTRIGVNPVADYDHMKRFCFPYIHMGIGNESGWETKIRHLKFKFNNHQSDRIVCDDQMEEYLLWKKMFIRTCSS